jgi:hypothetical protein
MEAKWERSVRPEESRRSAAREPRTKIGFGRVSRDKVSDLLPQLISSAPPLRTMMEQGRS